MMVTVFLSIKAGDLVGKYEVAVALRSPSGSSGTEGKPPHKWPVVLDGGVSGANLVLNFGIGRPEYGLYWFDVIWQNEALTSIPLRFVRPESSAQAAAPPKR
jgi:hypothetical protein